TRAVSAALIGTWLALSAATYAQQPSQSHVVPLVQSAVRTLDKRVEAVRGDRTKAGEPFVIRIRAEAGYIIMPHTHAVDENIVVLQGSWALGMGERFARQKVEVMEPGTFGFAGKDMAHFAVSKTDTVIQVHGVGPFFAKWVVPVYELTDKGVLYKTMAEDPGRAVTDFPKECFALKLGSRVRASHGEGKVIGGQCTPGELTQYRVEKATGEHFWGQRDELTAL